MSLNGTNHDTERDVELTDFPGAYLWKNGLLKIRLSHAASFRARDEETPIPMQAMKTSTSTMFESAPLNPPDSIFGLIEQFKLDPNPEKINLSVGVYQDESGKTPLMGCVADAERILLEAKGTESYLPIDGLGAYNEAVANLILGEQLACSAHRRTAQTPGGTGALRVAGDVLHQVLGVDTIWMSNPTWANHPKVYSAAELQLRHYEYLDEQGTGLDFQRMLDSLSKAEPGQAILLHTVCHNPTGADLDPEQWLQLQELIRERQLIPIFDFAYQGFGTGITEDAFPIRSFAENGLEFLVCNSFSKNFGLYSERVGSVTAIAASEPAADAMLSQIKATIRTSYSNPPLHGAAIVKTVLCDETLRANWESELTGVRNRICDLRVQFVEKMKELVPERDFEYIKRQRGMFSYSGLTKDQVDQLRTKYAIYTIGSGRINVAGINANNIDRICSAIKDVL